MQPNPEKAAVDFSGVLNILNALVSLCNDKAVLASKVEDLQRQNNELVNMLSQRAEIQTNEVSEVRQEDAVFDAQQG